MPVIAEPSPASVLAALVRMTGPVKLFVPLKVLVPESKASTPVAFVTLSSVRTLAAVLLLTICAPSAEIASVRLVVVVRTVLVAADTANDQRQKRMQNGFMK